MKRFINNAKQLFFDENNQLDKTFLAGLATLLIWTFSPGVSRLLSEGLSAFISGAINFGFGGSVVAISRLKNKSFNKPNRDNFSKALKTYIFYAVYCFANLLGVSMASDREAAMILNLISNLWPLSSLIFSIIISKREVKPMFAVACLLSIVGIAVGGYSSSTTSVAILIKNNIIPLICTIIAVLSWGIYSGLFTKNIKSVKDDYQPFAQVFVGLIMLTIAIVKKEQIGNITLSTAAALTYQLVFNAILAMSLWNYALTGKKNFELILLSNLAPLTSSLFSTLILGLGIEPKLLIGALIVVLSTLLAKRSIN